MILKTNRLNYFLSFVLVGLSAVGHSATASESFECLRDLMPITDRSALQRKRNGVEEPFLVRDKYIVFPEVHGKSVTGFYIYSPDGGQYYDAADIKGQIQPLENVSFNRADGIYDLVAQPAGLETVIVPFLPGFRYTVRKNSGGPVVLGSSVLPVIGALVSRPNLDLTTYHNPDDVNKNDLRRWFADRMGARAPASLEKVEIKRTLVKLKKSSAKSGAEVWAPLKAELQLRKTWVKDHNLDEKAFKQLSLVMEGSCKP